MSKKTDSTGTKESLIFVPTAALCPTGLKTFDHETFIPSSVPHIGEQKAATLDSIMPELLIFKKKAPGELAKNDFVVRSGIFGTTEGAASHDVITRVVGWSGFFGLPYEMLLGYEPETYSRASKK